MARPPRFDIDQLLDAAVRLAATGGPPAVTMSAVAHAVGAPSGSMYHRFTGRPALLAEVWLRTVERFQAGYHAVLAGESDPHRAARAAARHVVGWSRGNPDEAALLLYGAADFGRDDWSEEHTRRADLGNERVYASLTALAETLGATDARGRDRVALALVDLPLSLVRRYLRAGEPLPPHAEDLTEECAVALLT
ncbi:MULTISPECIES: TetR/AcrR family transcriptional regulator [Streptomyces]|uniref:TetR family transcriptional regulator n=2 Tax=Streptomyces TaxID=1883 RepID=A0A100YAB8_9ACTN|nr:MULTISPECIES: TetR/AcrR family transcriptional regulator [Streptomyces]KUH40589.1 TetR family transcriptional regulator [Streptomyces kanasensis]UUS33628.1 TetR/AcrR family transcriptional regulator [Streptomyces changanensis]